MERCRKRAQGRCFGHYVSSQYRPFWDWFCPNKTTLCRRRFGKNAAISPKPSDPKRGPGTCMCCQTRHFCTVLKLSSRSDCTRFPSRLCRRKRPVGCFHSGPLLFCQETAELWIIAAKEGQHVLYVIHDQMLRPATRGCASAFTTGCWVGQVSKHALCRIDAEGRSPEILRCKP